jgi:hypothetical protein
MTTDIILRDDDKGLDEVVAEGASVHLERMADDCFMLIVGKGNRRVAVELRAEVRNKLTAAVAWEDINGEH